MASRTWALTLINLRGEATTYAICMCPPQFRAPGLDLEPSTTVWYSVHLEDGQFFGLETGMECHAWTGTVPRYPAPGERVTMSMSLPAHLGDESQPGSTFDIRVEQGFPMIEESSPSRGNPGAYEVWTGYDFVVPNDKYLIGMGKINHRGQVAPVASINPFNNTRIQITPAMKFFILESNEEIGSIVDLEAFSANGATVDFTSGRGATSNTAQVLHGIDGAYITWYL